MKNINIENLNINLLIPYAKNSRTHSEQQINLIANSIKEFGFTNPVLIDSKNGIIAGHGRVMAANKLKILNVPCIRLSHLTENQKRAYVIADNKLALNSGWDEAILKSEIQDLSLLDFDLDMLGFDSDEIEEFLFIEPDIDDDISNRIPEAPIIPVSKKGDIWLLGEHRLMCGDSTNKQHVEALISGLKIDLIFTDPPYGVSYADKNIFLNKYDKGNINQTEIENDHMTVDETGKLWASVFSLWTTYLNDYSSYYIASPQIGDLMLMMMIVMNDNGFPVKHTLIWNKNNHVLGRCDYMYKHEPILYGWSKRHKFYGKGKYTKSVWDIAKPLKNDLHPTMKPVELVENCILNSSLIGHIVADMFLGSGTTLIAAELNGRKCIGMEYSENYCDVIIKRWQDLTKKQAVLEHSGETYQHIKDLSHAK